MISCQQSTKSEFKNNFKISEPNLDSIELSNTKNQINKTPKDVTVAPKQNTECQYDNEVNSIGIGLIIVPEKFKIYRDNKLSELYGEFDIYREEVSICSKYFKPDYGILHFVCIERTNKYFKVLVNFSTVLYLENNKENIFTTWNDYILSSYGIRRLTSNSGEISESQNLKSEPDDKSETLEIPEGYELFCPIEIKKEWLKVQYDCFYNEEENPNEGKPCNEYIDKCKNPTVGWIRWKKKNKILIDIFLMP